MKTTQVLIKTFALIIFVNAFVFSQQLTSSVDKTTVGQYERFQVYFNFNNVDINAIKNFRPPSFQNFKILGGPNQSTSMQIINGQISSSVTYSYILQPSAVGEFTISAATADYNGKTLSAQPIKIKVIQGNAPQSGGSDASGATEEELSKNVFIRAVPNKSKVMLGEQITVIYKLYTRLNISSPQISKLPVYQGFWAEELDSPNTLNFDIEMYNGERFRSAVIKRVALFPSKTGELTVTPFELDVPVLIKKKKQSRDVFDEFFNDSFFGRSETVQYRAKSNTVKVSVLPLPSNAPESFKGAVGDFSFNSQIDKKDVEQNEAVALKLTISGSGNINLLDIPKIQLPPGMETYDPKTSVSVNKSLVVSGKKVLEYLIVPRTVGEKEIPAVEFTYYSPGQNRYVTSSSPAYTINVKKGTGNFDSDVAGFSKEDVRLLSEDIRFIKTSSFEFDKLNELSLIGNWFWVAAILPLLILGTVLGIKKRQDKLSGNIQLLKYQKAVKVATNRLKTAKKVLNENNLPGFYAELAPALFGYLEDKLSLQKSEFTVDRAIEQLSARQLNEELIHRVRAISEQCEFARFAPSSLERHSADEIYNQAENVIVELENSISSRKRK
ncbi:MAG: BatD family protein [bacterium]